MKCRYGNENCKDKCCHDCDGEAECEGYGVSCQMTKEECQSFEKDHQWDGR